MSVTLTATTLDSVGYSCSRRRHVITLSFDRDRFRSIWGYACLLEMPAKGSLPAALWTSPRFEFNGEKFLHVNAMLSDAACRQRLEA